MKKERLKPIFAKGLVYALSAICIMGSSVFVLPDGESNVQAAAKTYITISSVDSTVENMIVKVGETKSVTGTVKYTFDSEVDINKLYSDGRLIHWATDNGSTLAGDYFKFVESSDDWYSVEKTEQTLTYSITGLSITGKAVGETNLVVGIGIGVPGETVWSENDPEIRIAVTVTAAENTANTSASNAATTRNQSSGNTYSGNSSVSHSSSGSGGGNTNTESIRSSGASKGYYAKTGKSSVRYDSSALSFNAKSAKVPATVKINKKTYKITTIASNAFTGYDKLNSVSIGKNIRKIAKDAFSGCDKLTTITINSKKLTAKNVKGAFANSNIKTVYVPADKVDSYKKIFTKKITGSKKNISVKVKKK